MTLEEAVAKGEPYCPDEKDPPAIDGDILRNLYLGTNVEPDNEQQGEGRSRSSRRITPAGIIIQGRADRPIVIVKGKRRPGTNEDAIDLSYLAGRDGGPLPPLVLRHCVISAKLLLAGSHFAFLSIEDCTIFKIDADHCTIDNHCRLIGLIPGKKRGREIGQIRMVGAKINGTTDLRGCRLVAPPRQKSVMASRKYADRFALSLASAEIAGRLLLDHDFTAKGGVSLYQAHIRNSASLNTARLESLDHTVAALDAEEVRVGGSLTWVNHAPNGGADGADGWHVAGKVILRRAEIGGDVKFDHCRWADRGARSISAQGVKNDRTLVDHISGGIDARGMNVAGQLRFGQGCRIGRWAAPPSRRVEEDVVSGVFGPSFDGWKASIGKGVRIESGRAPAIFAGPIFLNDSNIDHGVVVRGDIDLPRPEAATQKIPEALDLSDARIKGLVRMNCSLAGSLVLRRVSVDGDVELQRVEMRRPCLVPGSSELDCKQGTATILDLSSASISGALHIGDLSFDKEPKRADALRLMMHEDWLLKSSSGVARPYGNRHVLGSRGFVVVETVDDQLLLTGEAEQFLGLFDRATPLSDEYDVKAYISSYFQHVIDDLGPKTRLEIGGIERIPGAWRLRDCEFACGDAWQKADIHIGDDFGVSYQNGRETARNDPIAASSVFRIGPFCFPDPSGSIDLSGSNIKARAIGSPGAAVRHFANCNTIRPTVVDLRGLRCRAFDDNEAAAWIKLGEQTEWRLLMDGIEFEHFDDTDPKERAVSTDPAGTVEYGSRAFPATRPQGAALRERRTHMLHSFVAGQRVHRWKFVQELAQDPQYSPQPFEVFARAYIRSGDHLAADAVITAQKRLEWWSLFVGSREGFRKRWSRILGAAVGFTAVFATTDPLAIALPTVFSTEDRWSSPVAWLEAYGLNVIILLLIFWLAAFSWSWILLSAGYLFDLAFRFGLKPARAVTTFALCLLAGMVGTNAMPGLSPVTQHHLVSIRDTRVPGRRSELAQAIVPTDVAVEGCNVVSDSALDRAVYAFDVFVPLIDVRQECAFTIAREATFLRWLKAFYATLGWVVVSLTLLTITGVLRRDLEK